MVRSLVKQRLLSERSAMEGSSTNWKLSNVCADGTRIRLDR